MGRNSLTLAIAGPHGELQPPKRLLEVQHSRPKAIQEVLSCVDDDFLLQVMEETTRRGAMLDLELTKKEGLVGNVKLKY